MDSAALFARGQAVIPGGVNSPVRAFGAVGGQPVYMASGRGAYMTTVDGRRLLDLCGSWGPLILGHAHPEVVEAVTEAAARGMSFGANTAAEVTFAELICSCIPYVDKVRLVSSGTEATMTALRIARGATGRDRIIKFDGGYHGHSDGLLVAAGSGLLTGGITSSAGVAAETVAHVFLPPYNDPDAVDAIVDAHGDELAAIIVEPIAGNMGLVPPLPGFLARLRAACDRCGAVLIFDEVINGFRLGPSTYGNMAGVTPDLTCLGKIIGGGMPIGAIAGPAELMDHLAPCGKVYQAGTLSGNPVAVAAGLKTLQILLRDNPYPRLEALGSRLGQGLEEIAAEVRIAAHARTLGGMFTCFFRAEPVRRLADAKDCELERFAAFFRGMLSRGVYLPPSQFETAFVSAAHTEDDIDLFLGAAADTLEEVADA